LHAIFVQIAKNRWHFANLFLAGAPFIAFVYGTFLTRSGFLQDTSVHSFATMNRTALWLLVGLGSAAILSFGGLWVWRLLQARRATPKASEAKPQPERGVDRGSLYAAGIWLLTGFAICCAFGMSVPFLMSLSGKQPKVVEEALYHRVVSWLFVPTIALMAVAPFLGWRKLPVRQFLGRVTNIFLFSLGAVGLFMIWAKNPSFGARLDPTATVGFPFGAQISAAPWVFFLVWLCLFSITASLWKMAELWKRALPSLGGFITHVGVAVAMIGLIVSRGFEQKAELLVQDGRPASGLGYTVAYQKPAISKDFHNRHNTVEFAVTGDHEKFVAKPGYYLIEKPDQEPQTMVWPYIHGSPLYDVYFTLHPMVVEATDPIDFKPGQSKLFEENNTLITYSSFRREGEAGMAGTKFIAKVTMKTPEGTATAEPAIVIGGGGGPQFQPARLGSDYMISLNRMDAADRSVTLQLLYVNPLMPVEVFYKPLTILVWLGAGIMTFGGLFAAWYRRKAPTSAGVPVSNPEFTDHPARADATVSTSQV
jgi:cytochrome c-type biogenesis protein CcmF